jgi:polysaccharide deacetylase 2 family uncharacterized protein YibQ
VLFVNHEQYKQQKNLDNNPANQGYAGRVTIVVTDVSTFERSQQSSGPALIPNVTLAFPPDLVDRR